MPTRRDRSVFPHFQPIRKRVWIESGRPEFMGFAVFEFSPTHIRWWWEDEEGDVQEMPLAFIVQGSFDLAVSEMDERVQIATEHFAAAHRMMEKIARLASHDPNVRRISAQTRDPSA